MTVARVTLFTDYNLSQYQPNPLSTDANGNYKTFITAGLYQIQVTLAGATIPYIYYQAAGPANGSDYVLQHPTGNQVVDEPNGFSLSVTTLNSSAGALNGSLGATTPNSVTATTISGTTGTFFGNVTGPVFNAGTGYQIGSAAALNHVLLGNGTDYVDSATIPWSVISGGSGAGPFSNTGVPCPTNNFSSINCTSTQMVTALAGAAVLTAPSAAQAITYNVNGVNSLTISNPNAEHMRRPG